MIVVFEGPSYAGKSSIREATGALLRQRNVPVAEICHGGTLGGSLRSLMMEREQVLDPIEKLLLYGARLASNTAEVQRALSLAPTSVVLLDRYVISLVVLAHHVLGLPRELVERVSRIASRDLSVDVTVFLDISHREHALRGGKLDRAVFEKYRGGFRAERDRHEGVRMLLSFRGESVEDYAHKVLSEIGV